MGSAIGRMVSEIKSSNDSIWGKGEYRACRSGSTVDTAHSFSLVVENAILSEKNSNSKPPDNVHNFGLVVDNAIRSAKNSNSKSPDIDPSYSLVVDNAIRSVKNSNSKSPDIDPSFNLVVDNAIRSAKNINSSKSPDIDLSFSLVMDNAIRSAKNINSKSPDINSSFGLVDNAIRSVKNSNSKSPDIDPSFDWAVNNAIRNTDAEAEMAESAKRDAQVRSLLKLLEMRKREMRKRGMRIDPIQSYLTYKAYLSWSDTQVALALAPSTSCCNEVNLQE